MKNLPMFETELLSSRVRSWLVDEMKHGAFVEAEKLPAEADLAEMLMVSRSVIRDALLDLECDGFVTRLRGTGTLINHHVLRVPVRLDWEIDYVTMLHQAGYAASLKHAACKIEAAGKTVAGKLELPEETEMVVLEKLVLADEKPAIYFTDCFEKSLMDDFKQEGIDASVSVFDLIENHCNEAIFLNLSQVEALTADQQLASSMGIEEGRPLLHLSGVGYSKHGRAMLLSNVFYVSELCQFSVLRKKR